LEYRAARREAPNLSVRTSKLINPELSSRDHPKIRKHLDHFMIARRSARFCSKAWQKGQETSDFAAELSIRATTDVARFIFF
jgi:hypothetical protein